jgi:hypothetical protein
MSWPYSSIVFVKLAKGMLNMPICQIKTETVKDNTLTTSLTKKNEKLWNYPKSSFFMLTCGLSPNFGEKLLFFVTFLFFFS